MHAYPDKSEVSRAEKLRKADSPWVELPEVSLTMVLEAWIDCGMCMHGVNGAAPLTWSEIEAYSSACGKLSSMEKQQIRIMSKAYCQGLSDKAALSLPPYVSDDPEIILKGQIAMERMIDETMDLPKI